MSKLNIDQRTILDLLQDKHADFLIPDYQRPYTWGEDECLTLWDDLLSFACPDDDYSNFDSTKDEYFLGPIVTFKNANGKQEIIDGQQRLTTVMLLLRAWYVRFRDTQDTTSKTIRDLLSQCLWKTTEFGEADMERLKIDSQVASDDDKIQFLELLRTGEADPKWRSAYANNYRLFQGWIAELINTKMMLVPYFVNRILKNVILLPIEADGMDTALRIFSTLNDRGKPLADADIFKSQLYKFYSDRSEKDRFVSRWRELEKVASTAFNGERITPMDELFTRYMYFERAKKGVKDSTTPGLRTFYSQDSYSLLKRPETLANLEALADFWRRVEMQNGFSDAVLKDLYVLRYAPNGMWAYILSVYFLTYRDDVGNLDQEQLHQFLRRITAFILAHAVERPGVNALRTPIYPEMVNIVNQQPVTFDGHKKILKEIHERFRAFAFTNGRPITKSMLTWWAFQNEKQSVIPLSTGMEVEHIYSRRRAADSPLSNKENLDALGNKSILEKTVNIRASDYRFEDKKRYYLGFDTDDTVKHGTVVQDLIELAKDHEDFTEEDLVKRTELIIDSFMEELKREDLLASE